MTTTIIWTIAIISGLGLLLALTLYLVAQRFKVEEDPRIEFVEKAMPGANCGGCGFAGCHAFADSAVKAPNLDNHYCPVGGNETMKKVAEILGYEIKEKAPMVAVVRCNGTCANRPKVNDYDGSLSCKVKASLYAGDTGCAFGCLGRREQMYCLRSLYQSLSQGNNRTEEEGSEGDEGICLLRQQRQGPRCEEGLCSCLYRLWNMCQDLYSRCHRPRKQRGVYRS